MKAKELRTKFAAERDGIIPPVTNYASWLEKRLEQQPEVSGKWTLEDVIEELKGIDAFDAAKYFFDRYGGFQSHHPQIMPPGFEHLSGNEDELRIADWGQKFPKEAGDALFNS